MIEYKVLYSLIMIIFHLLATILLRVYFEVDIVKRSVRTYGKILCSIETYRLVSVGGTYYHFD